MALPRDLYLLSPSLTRDALDAGLRRAVAARVRGVVVPPLFARRSVDALRGSGVRVSSVVGYPLGLNKATVKAIEATSLAKDGVDAIELVPFAGPFLERSDPGERLERVRAELLEIVRGARAARPGLTVYVRLDLDVLRVDDADWPAIVLMLVRSACDGVRLVGVAACGDAGAAAAQAAGGPFTCEIVGLRDKVDADDQVRPTGF